MGPEQTQVECKALNLTPGGHMHYALHSEGAEPFYGRWDFMAVMPFQLLDYHLAFSDAEGSCVYHPLAPAGLCKPACRWCLRLMKTIPAY